MRSTMTRYGGGSPIFVPPNLTISAVTPDVFPSSLTAWMNAGGNENSRPHSSPTTSGPLELFARAFAMTSTSPNLTQPHPTSPNLTQRRTLPSDPHRRRPGLLNHVLDDGLEIVGLAVDA